MFVKPLMERSAGFANIKFVTVFTGDLVDDKTLIAVFIIRQAITNIAIRVFFFLFNRA